jgi:hypothetical protein
MKKKTIVIRVAVHPIKADLWTHRHKIKPGMSFREIGNIIGIKNKPQLIKHHLDVMVKMGTIDYVGGQYIFPK